jgi:hypothetical protein
MTLQLRPARFGIVQYGQFRDIVQTKKRVPGRSPYIERGGNHDTAKPPWKCRWFLEIGQTPERPQICLLDGVLRERAIAEYSERYRLSHRVRRFDEAAISLDVTCSSFQDEVADGLHVVTYTKDTRTRKV